MTREEAMNMSNEQAVQILIPMRNMMCDRYGCPISDAVFALDKAIEALSAERPRGEWIPVSERLPEIHDEVLVTAHGEVSIAWLYLDGEWRSNDMPQQMFKDIIAWMPMPEPYKAESEDKE